MKNSAFSLLITIAFAGINARNHFPVETGKAFVHPV